MNRRIVSYALVAVSMTMAMASRGFAQNAWFSLNLQFNAPSDLNSGGVWTVVAKADSFGLAGAVIKLANATAFTQFLSPPELDVHVQTLIGPVRDIVIGSSLQPPYPLGIGVIGSSFPSSYVDPAGLAPFGGYADIGSFTGGVALATGTFAAGVIPQWTTLLGNESDANVFTGPAPAPVANANTTVTVLTVRSNLTTIPEPAALHLGWLAAAGVAAILRRQRVRTAS